MLALMLLGLVMADPAADGRTRHSMVTGVMTGCAARHCTLQATFSIDGTGQSYERKRQCCRIQ